MADPTKDTMRPSGTVAADGGKELTESRPEIGPLVPVRSIAVASPLAMPAPRRRWLPIVLLILVVAGLGAATWVIQWGPAPVTLIAPHRGNAVEAVYATGIVEAIDTARVGTTVAGRLASVPAQEGDAVRAGQLLAQIDDRQARQRLGDAQARLALAEQELLRDKALVASGSRSVQALQRSMEERDRASAMVALSERDLDEYRIVAPLAGIVMKREVERGNTVGANAALFTVASTAHLRIAADVDERDIAQVKMDAPVAIRADAYPGEAFPARVTNIRRQGDAATRTFRVEANLPAATKLFIGMTVDVNIVVAERTGVLLLPMTAVRYDPPQGGRSGQGYVFRMVDGKAQRANVALGTAGTEAVELREGLGAEDMVIADPPPGTADGTRVRLRP